MTEIKIKIDSLFKLQKTMREVREDMIDDTTKILQRHDLKVKADLIDRIIKDNGIDKMLNEVTAIMEHKILIQQAKEQEDKNEINN